MKNRRIVSLVLAITMIFGCIGSLNMIAYAASDGEESWDYYCKGTGRSTPFRPDDQYVSEQNAPDFMWPYVNNAVKYDLIVCSDPELKKVEYSVYDLDKNYYTFPVTFETGVNYYWAVRYYDGKKYSNWSNVRRFRISPDAYEFVYPGADAVLAKIPDGHPRIYATPSTLGEFRSWKDDNPYSKNAYDAILSKADKYIDANEPLEEPKLVRDPNNEGNNAALLQQFRSNVEQQYNKGRQTALAYLLTGDEKYGKYSIKVWSEISKWDINGDTSYANQDQVHREIALYGAESYDFLYNLMTEDERKQLRDMVVARTKVMESLLGSIPKEPYDSHGWTAFGFIGIISLALYKDAPEAEEWLKTALDVYVSFLPPWSYQDGGWSQGTSYWQWSSQTNKDFVELLALGEYIDLSQKAWCRNEYRWMLYAFPPGSYGSFGDESNRGKSGGASKDIAARQLAFDNNPTLKWLIDQWGGYEGYNNISAYYAAAKSDKVQAKAPTTYPLAHEFSDVGWTVMSNDLIDVNRIQCTFKSSPYGSWNHSQADQNSFLIQAYGQNLAIKSGYYDSYHSAHDKAITRSTGAHNSVTIATNRGQLDDSFNAKGELTGFLNQIDFDMSAGDATKAYDGNLDKFERCMIYIRPDVFVVVDELDAKGDTEERFEWWLNAEHAIKTYEDGSGARLQEGSAVLDAKVQYPQKIKTFYNDTFAMSNMKEVPATGNYATANVHTRVWFTTPRVERTKMVVTMDVHKDGTGARYVDTEYHDDYMKMTFEDGTVVLVNLKSPGTKITTEEGITFDGTAVTYNDDSIMLSLGTTLQWGDKTLIQCEKRASVVMGQNELGISSYTDQKISIDTNNDYVDQITEITDYNGNKISDAYGIAYEKGMVVDSGKRTENQVKKSAEGTTRRSVQGIPVKSAKDEENSGVSGFDESESVVYTLDSAADGITFELARDNYTLMLNGKLIQSDESKSSVKVVIEGEDEKNFELSGYMRRDGTESYSGQINLDGAKYTVKSMSDGLFMSGLKVGDTKGIQNVDVSISKADNNQGENTVVLERVPVNILAADEVEDHERVKNDATVFIEAENAEEIESGRVYNTRQFMSGGAGITEHNKEGSTLKYTVEIPEDGDYTLALKYVAWDQGGAMRSILMDGKNYQMSLPQTASWGAEPSDWRAAVSQDTVKLKAGTYTMFIEAVSGSWNVDWIAFTKK